MKPEVRALARELGLGLAEKADSQDICFVPKGRYSDVIERLKPGALAPGDIVHVDGRRLGRHRGIINYTIGQRRGLGIPSSEPLFVVRLSAERNEVVVGPRDCLRTRGLVLKATNWLGDEPLSAGTALAAYARVRSSQPPQPAEILVDAEGLVEIGLRDGETGVAAGQACVLYADGSSEARVLGGGWIARTIEAGDAERAGDAADRHGAERRRLTPAVGIGTR